MANIQFTIGDQKVVLKARCFGPDLARIDDYWTQEALRKLMPIVDADLPNAIQNAAQQLANNVPSLVPAYGADETWIHLAGQQFQHVNNYLGQLLAISGDCTAPSGTFVTEVMGDPTLHAQRVQRGDYEGDEVWIHRSGTTIQHVTGYTGTGSPLSSAGMFVNLIALDPCKHVISAGFASASGTTYTSDEVWIHLAAGNVFQHTANYTGVCATYSGANQYVKAIAYDPCRHIMSATLDTPPNTTYTSDEVWIHLSGTQFQHTALYTGTGTSLASAGCLVQTIVIDPNKHVLSATFTAAAGGSYTADEQWIHLSGTQFQHTGPWSATSHSANSGGFFKDLIFDTWGHLASASDATLSGDGTWIGYDTSTYIISHTGPGAASGWAGSADNSKVLTYLVWDGRGHIISAQSTAA